MPASKIDLTEFAGMVTAPGLLSRSPASCITALNVEFPAPGLIRKRRGFSRQSGNAGGPVWKLLTSQLMDASLLAHVGTTTEATNFRFGDGSGAFTAPGIIDGGTMTRSRTVRTQMGVCQKNHYVTADEGVGRLEEDFFAAVVGRYAGMPRGLGPTDTSSSLTGGTAFADGAGRAYRITWHRMDASGVELGGAPSSRWVVSNTAAFPGYVAAAAASTVAFILIPFEWGTLDTPLDAAYFYRIWGTRQFLDTSQLGDDECYLLTEQFLTSTDITNGYVAFTDTTPDEYLLSSPRLHTNLLNFPPDEAGLLQGQANEDAPPPLANDVAYWQDCMWFADVTQRATISVTQIAALANNDTITVRANATALTLTAKTVPAVATDFFIHTAGNTTQDIRQTVVNLCDCINVNAGASGLYAYPLATTTTQPGAFVLEVHRPSAAPIRFDTSVPTKFSVGDGYILSANEDNFAQTNAMMFSKPLRADAVPPVNLLTAGPSDATILRIFPLRDRLLVFTDYGIWQVTGRTFADFACFPFDLGYRLMGRELVALCDEKVYAWCYEGIVEIDDGGVRVVSTPIEDSILNDLVLAGAGASDPLQAGRDAFAAQGFAVGYRNEHQVRFHFPQADDPADLNACAYWYAFDTRTRAWARGQFTTTLFGGYLDARSCGVVRMSDDRLALGCWSAGADTFVFLERRAYDGSDYKETARDGTDANIASVVIFQFQVPDMAGAQHWQQLVMNWDNATSSWRTIPTSIEVGFNTEAASSSNTVAPVRVDTRQEIPQTVRRGQRLLISIGHGLSEYFGITGVSQAYRAGSRFARQVTP